MQYDLILISQSDMVDYSGYSELPLDRISLYSKLVFPRMVYYKGGFRSHLDIFNHLKSGRFYADSSPEQRRELYNIWNLPGFSGIHIANYLKEFGIRVKVINNFDSEWDELFEAYTTSVKSGITPRVGISTTFYLSYSEIKKICKKLRGFCPSMEIILGGAFVNAEFLGKKAPMFEKPMRKYGVNYVLYAFNSEPDLKDLMLSLKNSTSMDKVNNLAYFEQGDFENGVFKTTQDVWNNAILNDTPNLWDTLDLPFLNNTIQLRTASGCTFSCAFCSYPSTARGSYTSDMENVEAQLQCILKNGQIQNIIFWMTPLTSRSTDSKNSLRYSKNTTLNGFHFLEFNI